jgi:hypothetical protein
LFQRVRAARIKTPPISAKPIEDGSGTLVKIALKVPDCELVMVLLELKSAAEHALPFVTKSGQKYS